jgi:anti-sigma B factor antagonist
MDTSDVAWTSPAADDPTGSGDAPPRHPSPDVMGGVTPSSSSSRSPSSSQPGEGAVHAVAVVPGRPPAPCPWVVVSEVAAPDGDRVVIGLVGEIDIANAGFLRAELAYLIDAGHVDIVTDLTRTVSISSSGLGVLVGALKTVRRRGGRLELVASGEGLLKVLRITRLTQVFTIHPTLEQALGR